LATIKVSKLDAARRQLDGAIELWFSDGDPVAIHALACAAHQIVQDIGANQGQRGAHIENLAKEVAKPEHLQEVVAELRRPMNFFKHADRDPRAMLEFEPSLSDFFITVAILGLREIGERPSHIQRAFGLWNSFHRPTWFKKGLLEEVAERFGVDAVERLKTLSKQEFLKTSLLVLAEKRTG
jgi:hypothetical protein